VTQPQNVTQTRPWGTSGGSEMTVQAETSTSGCGQAAVLQPSKKPLTPKQRAALDAGRRPFKPGYDARRNHEGVNGTTKARALFPFGPSRSSPGATPGDSTCPRIRRLGEKDRWADPSPD
jgi:hypothetical protein